MLKSKEPFAAEFDVMLELIVTWLEEFPTLFKCIASTMLVPLVTFKITLLTRSS